MRPAACDPGPKIHSWHRIQPQKPTQPVLYKSKLSLDLGLNTRTQPQHKIRNLEPKPKDQPQIQNETSNSKSKLHLMKNSQTCAFGNSQPALPHQPRNWNSNSKFKLNVHLELKTGTQPQRKNVSSNSKLQTHPEPLETLPQAFPDASMAASEPQPQTRRAAAERRNFQKVGAARWIYARFVESQ